MAVVAERRQVEEFIVSEENRIDNNLVSLDVIGDERGNLISLESNKNIPFDIKRVYYIYGTQEGVRRGLHAHKNLKQLLVCVSGSCHVLLDDGKTKSEYLLSSASKGLMVGSMVWREMYNFSKDCVLMVLADSFYDESDYIRDYFDFKGLTEVRNER